MGTLQYSQVRPAVAQSDLTTIAPYLFWLMFRNIASDGFVFEDPLNTGVLSQPGCVLASPAWENTATNGHRTTSTTGPATPPSPRSSWRQARCPPPSR